MLSLENEAAAWELLTLVKNVLATFAEFERDKTFSRNG